MGEDLLKQVHFTKRFEEGSVFETPALRRRIDLSGPYERVALGSIACDHMPFLPLNQGNCILTYRAHFRP